MKIDERKIISTAKNCIDDVMDAINDPDLAGWDKFYLGKVYAYLDVFGGCTDYAALAKEARADEHQ